MHAAANLPSYVAMMHLLGLFALALLFGGMVFFAAIVAPLIFAKLPSDHAGHFVRALFPRYYLYVFAAAALASLTLRGWPSLVTALVALTTAWLRQWLMPRINQLSDAALAGDDTAKPRFARAHQLSVLINAIQWLAITAALARVGFVPPA